MVAGTTVVAVKTEVGFGMRCVCTRHRLCPHGIFEEFTARGGSCKKVNVPEVTVLNTKQKATDAQLCCSYDLC